jgi:L-lysine exporter family protein LysE/ArgO
MFNACLAGLLTGLSLIVAIGAQNAYLLRQGLRGAHVGPVVAVCMVSDFALITAGVSGMGAFVARAGWALLAVRWLGVTFLTWYGLSSAWRARRPALALATSREDSAPPGAAQASRRREEAPLDRAGTPRGPAVRRALALTWLNPHVYLDTVLLIGSVGATHGPAGRWWFAAGACLASAVWFASLGYGARLLAPLLASPRAWQVLDLLIAATMLVIAVKLATG